LRNFRTVFANPCGDNRPDWEETAPSLNRLYLSACKPLAPVVRSGWEKLLQADPTWAQSIAADKLAEFMNNVLAQLWTIMETPPEKRSARPKPGIEFPRWPNGQCRVGPLLVFLGQGKRVLESVALQAEAALPGVSAADLAGQRAELLLVYDLVVQNEIERLCGPCTEGAGCPLSGSGRHWQPA
jgi:hypothetical protein